MDRETVLTLLAGMRSQVGALQAQIVALEAVVSREPEAPVEPPAPAGCQHGQVENQGTFGMPELRCLECGATVDR